MKNVKQPEIEALVERCRKQDRKAQYELYQRYVKAMFNTACRIVHKTEEAEDVLQEAFLDAFRKIDRFRGDSTFGAWLKRIVVNKSLDHLKKRKAQFISLEEAGPLSPQTESPADTSNWNMEAVRNAIDALPDGYRVVFSLYLLEGYDHQEISDLLGISVSASKSQLSRAKSKLRKMLDPSGGAIYRDDSLHMTSGLRTGS